MKRKILIALLALGTVGGFSSGFVHLARGARAHCSRSAHAETFEQRVARVCTDAARDSARANPVPAAAPPAAAPPAAPLSP